MVGQQVREALGRLRLPGEEQRRFDQLQFHQHETLAADHAIHPRIRRHVVARDSERGQGAPGRGARRGIGHRRFAAAAVFVLHAVVARGGALDDGVAVLAAEIQQRPLAGAGDFGKVRLHQVIQRRRQRRHGRGERIVADLATQGLPRAAADRRLDHHRRAGHRRQHARQFAAVRQPGRDGRHAQAREFEQVALVAVPAQQAAVVQRGDAEPVEAIQPLPERRGVLVVVPDRADQHQVECRPVDLRVVPHAHRRRYAELRQRGGEVRVVRVVPGARGTGGEGESGGVIGQRHRRNLAALAGVARGPVPDGTGESVPDNGKVAGVLTEPANAYARRLNTWDAAMIVIGGVIGAGIFLTPSTVARHTSSGVELLILWAIGGGLTLAGVLCYAELGARRPQAGGIYVYLREAFGLMPAFLFGWTMALINYPGSVAAVATMFAEYLCSALGLGGQGYVKPVAVGAIVFIVGINLFGIRAGAWLQNVFTVIKLLAIALRVITGLVLAHGHRGVALIGQPATPASPWAFAGALLPVLFTYGGFHYLNDLAGEVRNPQRTLPRALGIGMTGVMLAYVLANFAYLAGLGHAGLAASHAPAADLMERLFGARGATLIALGIACSTFGYCNIAIAGGARVLQTMGADGMFFSAVGRIEPQSRAPQVALATLGAWAIVLTVSGSFNQLLDYTTVGEWLAHACSIATLFWYRRYLSEPSPYRVPFYPWLPMIFVVTVLGVIGATAIHNPGDAGMS